MTPAPERRRTPWAIGIYFNPAAMDAAAHDEVIRRLDAAGAGKPAGRQYHVCFGNESKLQVSDVWESQEEFDKFGTTLMPILQELGVDPGQPAIESIHNVIA